MTTPLYSISVVAFNNLALTQRCVASVLANSQDFELILTDNASTDGTGAWAAALSATDPRIRVITNPENRGFIQPQNDAFASALGLFFIALNNDVEVGAGWLDAMRAAFDANPRLSVCGALSGCSVLGKNGIGHGLQKGEEPDYVEGSCLMVRVELQRKHGLFSPELKFAYAEDSDLSLRMRSLGYEIALVKLPLHHTGAATTKIVRASIDIEGYELRNRHILLSRWKNFFEQKDRNGVIRERVLIRRTGGMGDVLMMTPAIAAFRLKHPDVRVSVSTVCPQVLQNNPDIESIHPVDHGHHGFSRVFDLNLAYERRPLDHPIRVYADELELKPHEMTDWRMKLRPSDIDRAAAREMLPQGPRYAVVHAGLIGGWIGRQWHGDWNQLFHRLRGAGYRVVRVGNEHTPEFIADITSLSAPVGRLAAILERSALFVGLDSMPFHAAQAVGIPTVGIFGCVDPALRIIPGTRTTGVVAKNVGCIGCHSYLPAPRSVTKGCLREDERCMTRLTIDDIMEGVAKVAR